MRIQITALLLGAIVAGHPAIAQEKAPAGASVAAQPKQTPDQQRIAELEDLLARQTLIAENARQSQEALRAEMKLKDELLVLGRERNAELYAIAEEIADKYVRNRSVDPFLQTSRVKMENLRQSYEDRLRAARIYEATLPPSVQQRMDAELGAAPGAQQPANPQN